MVTKKRIILGNLRTFSQFCLLASVFCILSSLSALNLFAVGDASAAIASVQSRYAAAKTVTGSFQQTFRAPGIEKTESGIFWLMQPGLMRWDYQTPEQKLFVADGRESFLYVPSDKQVMVRRYGAAEMRSTPLTFLLGRQDILQAFTVSWETGLPPKYQGTLVLHLDPRTPGSEYEYIVLEFETASYELRRIIVRDRTGGTSEFEFTNVVTNAKIGRKQFEFKIPKGIEIIRLDDKD